MRAALAVPYVQATRTGPDRVPYVLCDVGTCRRELQSSLDDIRMINKKAEKTAVALATRLGENLSTPPRQ